MCVCVCAFLNSGSNSHHHHHQDCTQNEECDVRWQRFYLAPARFCDWQIIDQASFLLIFVIWFFFKFTFKFKLRIYSHVLYTIMCIRINRVDKFCFYFHYSYIDLLRSIYTGCEYIQIFKWNATYLHLYIGMRAALVVFEQLDGHTELCWCHSIILLQYVSINVQI